MAKVKVTDLVLRDGHQSLFATRMLTSDMLPVADQLNKAGFWSLETWGGATFDSCIRFLNEDPWERIRTLKKAMPNTPMQMLLRGQNLLGYRHYADDLVEKFVERAAVNGVDVFRIFDALNDPRNLQTSIKAVKKAGKHAQATISYTVSPVDTIEKYIEMGKQMQEMGADSLCIKDMASLLKPYDAYELVKGLKKALDIPINVHSHATTGMSVATLVKGVEAGADMIDTVISSMSMGTSHSPTETMVEIFKGTQYDTGLNTKILLEISAHFREVRKKYKQFESSFLGADTRILEAQIPGGMLSNMEKQLKDQGAGDKIDAVLEEMAVVKKDFGYPPLVTPTSQIVGTQAVFNVLFGRYQNLTAESKDLLVGKYGRTAAQPNPDLVKKALSELGMDKAIDHRPADDIPNELGKIEAELKEKLNVKKVEIEDVLTYAMFPQVGLKFFETRANGPVTFEAPKETTAPAPAAAKSGAAAKYVVNVDGKDYTVSVRDEGTMVVTEKKGASSAPAAESKVSADTYTALEAPVTGTVLKLSKNEGESVEKGDIILMVESMKMELPVKATVSGTIKYMVKAGDQIQAHQVIAEIG